MTLAAGGRGSRRGSPGEARGRGESMGEVVPDGSPVVTGGEGSGFPPILRGLGVGLVTVMVVTAAGGSGGC